MTLSSHPRHTMRHTARSVTALATTIGVVLTTVPVAAAAPIAPTTGALTARSASTPDLEPLLPTFLQRHISFATEQRTYVNPEKGKVQTVIRRSGLTNSSALFDLDRNGDVTLEVRTRVDPSYRVAYFYAGVQYGCFGGVGDPKVETSIDTNTTISVNGKWKTHATTYPITQFLQQSARTAVKGAIAGAECGASEGPGCAEMAKFLATEVPREVFATLELARIITNTGTSEMGVSAKPKIVPTFSASVYPGQTSVVPFYFLRYSPGWNTVRVTNMNLQGSGCIGPAYIRPFVVTLGRTKSGNYVNYQLIGQSYPFYPNKLFRMSER
ncbi:MspA family porin [Lawsonella clevelandensis]|uniref:Uncharacterized protein n=1 Tax=Lawsonella clevelandensis TaxID=1528099 RepID=A0A0M3TBD8_9ACTN|nr:MspA family porin [Lawsonella clevelandensis]ALE18710.1 hypothetical protein AL705_02315 [Lawsonella clevelandensis]ALE34397.1 hypothetical protein IY73_02350 [Lawsonella clevelandensis]MDU7192763.1 MspA family porin [Lawsonella clevelandensis]